MTKPVRFDLIDLKLFVAVARAGSLSRGAASLPLALSAASSRLRLLEHRLGFSLFERHASGVRLNPAGEQLLEHAQRVLRAAQDAQAAMDQLLDGQRELLRLYANATANSTVLPAELGRFLAERPHVDISLNECPSREVIEAVRNGEADLGVIDTDYAPADLLTLPLNRYRLAVLLYPEHALATQASISLRELAEQALVGQPAHTALQGFLHKMAELAGVDLHVRARAPSFAAMARLVAGGAGVAVLPESTGRSFRDSLGLVLLPLNEEWAERGLQLCLRPWDGLSPTVRALAAHLGGVS